MELREPFLSGAHIPRPEGSLLRVAVLGPPEIMHDGSRLTFSLRKAQALLLYLAVEGGMHSRSKLAALLWPDSEAPTARTALRNALAQLRNLLTASPVANSPLLSQQDALGLNPQAALWLDLDVIQQAWKEVQRISTVPTEPQRTALVAQVQHALSLVRGPFLDGFWLREETSFDAWVQQQQQQWQVRLHVLYDRLSGWQEAGGEMEQAQATLFCWLELDPLSEEAYRRLMRVHLTLGDAAAALQVYATCRARLAQELQVEPSADIITLAAHIRALAARRSTSPQARPSLVQNRPPSELAVPLIGRTSDFTQLVSCYQQARLGQPQTVILVGEEGIGKTRLANEFVAWARARGADVLSGHAFEMEGQLPYQPLVEALRSRLEEENAPEDLLEDLWLSELSRLLPELRVRYPDLPIPTQDELTASLRLFEAVARLLDALTRRAPLVLLLDDLHWMDGASLDLVRYLGHFWKDHRSRVLLVGTARREELALNPELSAQLVDPRRDLPITSITLQPLSKAETLQLVEAIVGEDEHCGRSAGKRHELLSGRQATLAASPVSKTPVAVLSDFLFAQTGGQPLYLLETLKLLRERKWLEPRLGVDGTWRLEPTQEMATVVAQKRVGRELVPPSVSAMILVRLSKLTRPARQIVMTSAVLGSRVSAQLLWQVAELGVQAGIEALEEAVKSGLLREEEAGADRPSGYGFSHELMRQVVYTELGTARRQVLHQRALSKLHVEGVSASEQAAQVVLV